MSKLTFWKIAFTISIVLYSCVRPTPPPVTTPTLELFPDNPERIIFTPSEAVDPESTLIYFLVDHSTPVTKPTDGCGELGKQNINYVDFMIANVLIPSVIDNHKGDLFLGVGTFDSIFKEVVEPINIASMPNEWTSHVPISDDNTYYTRGIEGALTAMYDKAPNTIQKRILIIVTDGFFSNETYNTTKARVDKAVLQQHDPKLHIEFALLCDKYLASWIPMTSTSNVFVDKLENITKHLINDDLRAFLPLGSKVILPTDTNTSISIAGYNTNATFLYWSTDVTQKLTILGRDGRFNESTNTREIKTDNSIYPEEGCPNHTYTLPSTPKSNWFLFVHSWLPKFEGVLKAQENEPIEIINNHAVIFQYDIYEKTLNNNLESWKECFSANLVAPNGDPLNGFVTSIPCGSGNLCFDNIEKKLYGYLRWNPPQYEDTKQKVEIKLVVKSSTDNPISILESALINIPINFETTSETPDKPVVNSEEIQQDFHFSNVASQPKIYLATGLDIDQVNKKSQNLGKQFQSLGFEVNDEVASKLVPTQDCLLSQDPSTAVYVCISSNPDNSPLEYTYTFRSYDYIVSNLELNQLFFVWEEDRGTKAIT